MTDARTRLSVILPAHDEAEYIGDCLCAVLGSDTNGFDAELIVVANACRDATADIARGFAMDAEAKGWDFDVIDTPEPGKLNALNLGEEEAKGTILAYLDADVIVSPDVLRQVVEVLATDQPRYASGTPIVAPAKSLITRGFARVWQRLPFMTEGVPGFGLFAVNRAGRSRWDSFPAIISDDTYVRLQFAPEERIRVPATYSWPMVEGLRGLVRVRRRQDAGVQEITRWYPELLKNDENHSPSAVLLLRIAMSDPIGFASYLLVKLLVKTRYAHTAQRWARGR